MLVRGDLFFKLSEFIEQDGLRLYHEKQMHEDLPLHGRDFLSRLGPRKIVRAARVIIRQNTTESALLIAFYRSMTPWMVWLLP
jgi:hypothetical protein